MRQRRPALVVAAGDIQAHHSLVWVLMITSADNRRWPSDVAVSDLATAGLPAASVVRTAKVAVIDVRDAERLGTLPMADRSAIATKLSEHLGGIIQFDRALKMVPADEAEQDHTLSPGESERVIGFAKLVGQLEVMIQKSGNTGRFRRRRLDVPLAQ